MRVFEDAGLRLRGVSLAVVKGQWLVVSARGSLRSRTNGGLASGSDDDRHTILVAHGVVETIRGRVVAQTKRQSGEKIIAWVLISVHTRGRQQGIDFCRDC